MALRRFFLFSCLSLSMFLAACGEEKPATPAGDPKPVTQKGPTLTPVVNNGDGEDEETLTDTDLDRIDRIPVEEMRAQLLKALEEQIAPKIEAEFEGLAVGPKVLPLVQEKLKQITEEFKNAPAARSSDLFYFLQDKLSELETYTNEALRKAESDLIRYKIQPETDEDESGESEEDYYEE